ncbi:MAG: GspE/PulE family protein [Candidatus Pacebacteria bacterium]|nr:GspE/PulE family protein [Candidatus Paceibacterota bacterium]
MSVLDNNRQDKKIAEIKNKEEEVFVERIAKKFDLSYIDLSDATIDTNALALLSEKESRLAHVAGFKLTGKDLYLAIKSPNLPETKKVIKKLEVKYNIGFHLVSTRSLEKAWKRYADISHATSVHGGLLDIDSDEMKRISGNIKTNKDIADVFNKILTGTSIRKTTELMEIIFGSAIATKSSDIHIEAQDEQVRIRYRQDGVLQDVVFFDHESYRKILSRIKLLSKMKLTRHNNAQDGRFTIDFDGKEIEVRVSVIPSAYGESFVMRILNPDGINVGIEGLGIEPKLFEILMREIEKPNGMILTTGPTGSGKTTTLYSFMRKVYTPEVKILTIEDPIEYHLDGISQTQINKPKGYTFLSGLRAALRQDPDIVMVGEIRDGETANIAVNASLTGHLVLSTLHTNSAAGVIPRLIDLGVSPQILAAALSVSLAQRLIRKVCQNCKYEIEPTYEQEQTIRNIMLRASENGKDISAYGLSLGQKITLTEGRGCEKCNGTGYKGRMGIFEAIITDETIEELLNKKPSEQEVRRVADKQGLLNMREDGIIKIINGTTSFSEVKAVVDMEVKDIKKTKKTPLTKIQHNNTDTIFNTLQTNPNSAIESNSIEISLLIDYLKKLEHEQVINPEIDASEKIALLQNTILDLMKNKQIKKMFKDSEDVDIHDTFSGLAGDLEKLHTEQQQNPRIDISHKIKNIRQEIEFTQK